MDGAPRPGTGETWIGDDAAVVRCGSGWLLLAADAVVAGVHADLGLTGVDDLGWKVMAANVSDIAAMGGVPGHALVTVAGPPETDLEALYAGIGAAAVAFGCPVVGGDLTNAPTLVVTVAVTGHVGGGAGGAPGGAVAGGGAAGGGAAGGGAAGGAAVGEGGAAGGPVLRSGARPGDGIWVSGPLGAAAAGLRSYRRGGPPADAADRAVREVHARPRPALEAGLAARAAGAHAMIDVSDGLAADLGHVADASGVGFRLDAVPVAEGATEADALGGGEDYAVVFTAPDGDAAVLAAFAAAGVAPPERIGTVTGDPAERSLRGQPLPPAGWEHTWGGRGGQ